jgi:FkbM family methyltransferase
LTVASPLQRLAPRRLVWWLLSRARSRWALRLIAFPLLGGLVHAVSHRVWPKGRRAWVAVEAGPARGLELLLDVRYDAKSWLGRIEPELQARLPELVQPGAVVWDVGAHTGFFTLLLARLTGEHGRVVAFEPDDESLGALVAAVERNGFANVEVRPVAVWSAPGTVGFERRSDAEGGAHGAVLLEGGTVEVAATTLDEEAATGPPPSLVKIDVEGGEEHVLLGASRLLSEWRPTVVCEVHTARRGNEDLLPRVHGILAGAGYDVEELDPGRSPVHLLARPRR